MIEVVSGCVVCLTGCYFVVTGPRLSSFSSLTLCLSPPALLLCSLLLSLTPGNTRAGLRDEVRARAGDTVALSCAVNKPRCGDFHSIKWYKENRRVYVYSPVVDFSKESVSISSSGIRN